MSSKEKVVEIWREDGILLERFTGAANLVAQTIREYRKEGEDLGYKIFTKVYA